MKAPSARYSGQARPSIDARHPGYPELETTKKAGDAPASTPNSSDTVEEWDTTTAFTGSSETDAQSRLKRSSPPAISAVLSGLKLGSPSAAIVLVAPSTCRVLRTNQAGGSWAIGCHVPGEIFLRPGSRIATPAGSLSRPA